MSLRDQLDRNLRAMARELAVNPSADQREWLAMAGEVFGFEVTQNVTLVPSGDQNCHRFPSVESTGDENGHFGVTKIVTRWPGGSRNAGN